MSKKRYLNTRFWYDSYIAELDPSEKLLFIYLLTNQYSDLCGIYEIPYKHIGLDTGFTNEIIKLILTRFENDGKIFYYKGWVLVKNFTKHQAVNDSMRIGIERSLKEIPIEITSYFTQKIPDCLQTAPKLYAESALPIPIPIPIPKLKLKPKPKGELAVAPLFSFPLEETEGALELLVKMKTRFEASASTYDLAEYLHTSLFVYCYTGLDDPFPFSYRKISESWTLNYGKWLKLAKDFREHVDLQEFSEASKDIGKRMRNREITNPKILPIALFRGYCKNYASCSTSKN